MNVINIGLTRVIEREGVVLGQFGNWIIFIGTQGYSHHSLLIH